jgi:hypothetical protein
VVLAEGLYAAATAAGCAQVQVSHEPEHVTHATADAAWAYQEASRWGEGLHHLPTKPADLREQAGKPSCAGWSACAPGTAGATRGLG